jgi:hypothetical protein
MEEFRWSPSLHPPVVHVKPVTDPKTGQTTIVPGNKAVWVMAPVTVAWDVATSPILGLGMLWLWATKFNG